MVRYVAIFPVLCAFVALILSFLCIFAGSKPGMMENYDIVTLNTSRIGVDVIKEDAQRKSGGDNDEGLFGTFHRLEGKFEHLSHEAEQELEDAANDVLQSFAQAIGLHDFYSLHVLDFCEGYYAGEGSADRRVTYCSKSKGFFNFNPSQTLQRELNASGTGITLEDLHWPSAIDEAIDTLKAGFNVMFFLYAVGAAATGMAMLASLVGVFRYERIVGTANVFLTQFAFFSLFIAAAILTGAATKMTRVINDYGGEVSITAARGDSLIAMSWTAMFLMFMATATWMVDRFLAKRKEKKIPKQFE